MKVLTSKPVDFVTGDRLDPLDLNAAWLYAKDAIADVASKEWQPSICVLPFVTDVGAPYTQATSAEVRTIRFKSPVDLVVERAFLHANMTSDDAVEVTIETAAGATPAGATVPWLTTGAAVATADADVTDVAPGRVYIVAGTEYLIKVAPASGNMSLERFDVVLHLASSRWLASADPVDAVAINTMGGGDSPDADVTNQNNTAIADEAAKFSSSKRALTAVYCIAHAVLSSTDADLRTFHLPKFEATRAQSKAVRIYLFAAMAGTGGTDVTVATTLDGTTTTHTLSVAGVTQATKDSGALALDMDDVAGCTVDGSEDLAIVLANADAAVVADKLYALVWVSRD